MKKRYLLLSLAMLTIVLLASTSVAYFTAKDSKENVFTVGDVKIELKEEAWKANEDHLIGPGNSYDKNPTVKNIGSNDAYVRITVSISHYDILKRAVSSADFKPSNLFDGYDSNVWIATGDPKVEGDKIIYSYYYHQILKVGKTTEALFDKITFPNDLNVVVINEMTSDLEIEIKADAIQSDNFNDYVDAFKAFDLKP